MKYFFKNNKEFLIEFNEKKLKEIFDSDIKFKEFFNSDIYFYHMDNLPTWVIKVKV